MSKNISKDTKTLESRISPYLNNYGQVIVDEKIDKQKLVEYHAKVSNFIISNKKKYEEKFQEIITENKLENREASPPLPGLQWGGRQNF